VSIVQAPIYHYSSRTSVLSAGIALWNPPVLFLEGFGHDRLCQRVNTSIMNSHLVELVILIHTQVFQGAVAAKTFQNTTGTWGRPFFCVDECAFCYSTWYNLYCSTLVAEYLYCRAAVWYYDILQYYSAD
jgi:hypothetical protein